MKVALNAGADARFDMTAMMDIVFQLIAFFMIVSTFIVMEKIEVELPVAAHAVQAENQADRLLVSVRADGAIWYGVQRTTLAELPAIITAATAERARRV
ncbi:MAG TPA: biopolymer transporter ExbD, partial [Candidatus Synoicihabitans sp.]|nr:biopolymer transporter ExbD [Candidatus Synoicihabitans sp.]